MAMVYGTIRSMKKGFTLLELLVTISIIGILLGVGAASFATAQKRGRDSRRQSDMKSIQKALEQCYAVDSSYPVSVTSGSALTCTGAAVTMNQVPSDPKDDATYSYASMYSVGVGNADYCLCALLENIGKGNASAMGSGGSCTFATGVGADYFCTASQQ